MARADRAFDISRPLSSGAGHGRTEHHAALVASSSGAVAAQPPENDHPLTTV